MSVSLLSHESSTNRIVVRCTNNKRQGTIILCVCTELQHVCMSFSWERTTETCIAFLLQNTHTGRYSSQCGGSTRVLLYHYCRVWPTVIPLAQYGYTRGWFARIYTERFERLVVLNNYVIWMELMKFHVVFALLWLRELQGSFEISVTPNSVILRETLIKSWKEPSKKR